MIKDLKVRHDKDRKMFIMDIDEDATAHIAYILKDGKMFLTYSEVPFSLRGKGYGKVLVEKTFEQLTEEGYTAVAKESEKWNAIIE